MTDRTTVHLVVDPSLLAAIDEFAAQEKISRSALMRRLLVLGVEHYPVLTTKDARRAAAYAKLLKAIFDGR